MITLRNSTSLAEALALAMTQPGSLHELAALPESSIQQISQLISDEDWYGDIHLVKAVTGELWKVPNAVAFIAHSIWCAHREAKWLITTDQLQETAMTYQFYQEENFIQTHNQPTIIIAPMTLGTHDAVHLILAAVHRFQPQRPVVFYGEQMETFLELHPEHKKLFAKDNIAGIKQILHTLQSGGLFLTYPDFAYSQHSAVQGQLFGLPRSFSTGLLKIALTSKALLLPVTCGKTDASLYTKFYSPIPPNKTSEFSRLPDNIRIELVCLLVSKILEGLIIQVPNQWRLLATLTHESEKMA